MHGDPRVTFAAAGIERAAQCRGNEAEIARLAADRGARSLVLWRGKVLMEGDQAGFLPMSHPLLAGAAEPLFLAMADGTPVFAHDMSPWQPDAEATGNQPDEQRHPALPANWRFMDLRPVMAQLPPAEAELLASAKAVFGWHLTHQFCARCGSPSRIVQAGWQRQCPSCGAQHFPRTDPVVIMLVVRGNRILLGRSPGWPDGMYSLLAGFVEPGETMENAVRREVAEETGILVGQVTYLASQPWPFPTSLMLGCRGEALSDRIDLDPVELEDALWLSREELAAVFAGGDDRMKPPRRGAIAEFLLKGWLEGRW